MLKGGVVWTQGSSGPRIDMAVEAAERGSVVSFISLQRVISSAFMISNRAPKGSIMSPSSKRTAKGGMTNR